jgi:hypothetical protein
LPYLEILELSNLPKVTKIDRGICGGKGAFPRLEYMAISIMEGLEEWNTTYSGEDGVESFMFPTLEKLIVLGCPRLRLKPCPPKCRKWIISSSSQVISSLEEVQTSRSHRSNNSTPPTTTKLTIEGSHSHNSFRLFHHFPALQKLKLSCRELTSLPEGIQQLSSLESLTLAWCDSIRALPEWLNDMSSLKRLHIMGCGSIKSLPSCIQKLPNLEHLVIDCNQELKQWCQSGENEANLAHINVVSSPPDKIYCS